LALISLIAVFALPASWRVVLPGGWPSIFLVGVVAGVTLAIRSYRIGVWIEGDKVIVRGYFWTRTIRREAVIDAGEGLTPFILWRDAKGKVRRTRVTAFENGPFQFQSYSDHNAQCLHDLLRILGADHRTPRQGDRSRNKRRRKSAS
jgi:hypothetical protein